MAHATIQPGQWEYVSDDSLWKIEQKACNMKTFAACFTCLACSMVTTSLLAQGLINWNNTSGTLISLGGASMPVRVSPETTYYFGLFIAPLGTPSPWGISDPNWDYVAAYTMNSTAAAGAGRMQNPGTATVTGFSSGTTVNFIVRVWQSTSGGADWEAAKPGLTVIAQSALGTATLGGGAIPVPMAFGTAAGQIGGFHIDCLSCPPYWMHVSAYPQSITTNVGSDVVIFGDAFPYHPSGFLRFQWYKNGSPIVGAISRNLTLTHVSLNDSGYYHLNAHDDLNYGSSDPITLTVFIPAIPATLASPTYAPNTQFQFTVTGSAGSNYVVQVATNLSPPTTWISLFTNASPFTFVDSNAQNFPQRFYRAYAP
jgi:hypothetical protein